MDKVISVVQRKNDQSGPKTILGKYKTLAASSGGELSTERLYKFLAGENARVMNRRMADGSLDKQLLEECKIFAAFYITRISLPVRRQISDRFGGLPSFLKTGIEELSKTSRSFPLDQPLDLSEEQLAKIDSFAKYVESLDVNRIASVLVKHPDGMQNAKEVIPLSRDMSSEDMRTRRSLFLVYVGYMVQFGGQLILRLCYSKSEFVLMGFHAQNGTLRPIDAEHLKQLYSNHENAEKATKNVEFRTPAWS